MGYWSKGVYVEGGAENRKQLNEVRAIVDQVVSNVECGAISATDAMRQLLDDYPVLKKEHRNHPLIASGLTELFARSYCPELPQTYRETVQPVTIPALLRENSEVETLEVLPRLESGAE